MKPIILVGIALIILGVVALVYQGIPYTSREKVLQIGPLEATAKTKKTIAVPPIVGGLVLAGGIVLVLLGSRKKGKD